MHIQTNTEGVGFMYLMVQGDLNGVDVTCGL